MSLRSDRATSGEAQPLLSDVLGGLVTNVPSHRVPPNASPDLQNITMHRGAAEKRGGLVPILHTQPGVCSARNVGYHSRGQVTIGGEPTNTDFLVVPGCAHAGHRPMWDAPDVRNGITLDLFLIVEDLTTSHGGNAHAGPTPFGPAPYTVKVRPILSKGPLRRHAEPNSGVQPGTAGWNYTSRWGPVGADLHAMPFFLYLYYNGSTWFFQFSFHYRYGGNWHLKTLSTSIGALGGIMTGVKYHVVAGYDCAQNTATLRIGSWFDYGTPSYVTVTESIEIEAPDPMTLSTTGPIQLFDCPQEIIEAPATIDVSRPPGFGLGGPTDGGYWFATKRFEGRVEDIVIYRGLVTDVETGALDRTRRIDPDAPPATRLQHWPIQSETDDHFDEVTGLGNHFYRSPSAPFHSPTGGFEGGALAFNGTTAYALIEMAGINPIANNWSDGRGGRTNWRSMWRSDATRPDPGAFDNMVRLNHTHALEVAFWPESIEPNNEQVVAEVHGVFRIIISSDGYVRAYVRGPQAWPNIPNYVDIGRSEHQIVPGRRYHVIVARIDATHAQLYVNGALEATATVSASSGTSWPISGVTIGMGARLLTSSTADATSLPDADTPTADQLNTDIRTGFFGRVETVRILAGDLPIDDEGIQTSRQTRLENYTVEFKRLFQLTSGTTGISVNDKGQIPFINTGHLVVSPVILAPDGANARPILANLTPTDYQTYIPAPSVGGPWPVPLASVSVVKCVGAWDFTNEIADVGRDNAYQHRVEYRARLASDFMKAVWVQRIEAEQDVFGLSGTLQLRCIESDLLTESDDNFGFRSWSNLNGPYLVLGPRALAPQWAEGFLQPKLGTNPIAMVADWQIEATGDVLLMAACRRSLYWLRPVWSHLSPFETRPGSLSFGGNKNDWARAPVDPIQVDETWDTAQTVIDVWIRPERLDGNRLIACAGNILAARVRYCIFLANGQIQVLGQVAGGYTWRWISGSVNTSPTRNQAAVAVRQGVWQHLAVRIGFSQVLAWVDGQQIEMVDSVAIGLGDSIDAGAIQESFYLWLGGVSADQEHAEFVRTGGASLMTIEFKPWLGQMAQFREASTMAHLPFTATTSAQVPRTPGIATDRFTWNLNDGVGWTAAPSVGDAAMEVGIRELIPAATDLPDAGSTAMQSAVFRQRLLFTTLRRPRSVSFVSLTEEPHFLVSPLGVIQPPAQLLSYQDPAAIQFTGSGSEWSGTEVVSVYVSFVNVRNGEESELSLIGIAKGPGTPTATVQVNNVPTSDDPGVTSRRIYFQIDFGGTPILSGELGDNKSRSWSIDDKAGQGLTSPAPGTRLPAEPCRRLAIDQGVVVLVGLTANPNVLFPSGDSPGHFSLQGLTPIDSEDGQGLVGAATILGGIYVYKRNGTWQLQASGGALSLRVVNSSAGCAGGTTVYDNVAYGANERGVWASNGNSVQYMSPQLEGSFDDVDVSEAGLLAQQGAFFYPNSQYWLSVRKDGATANTDVFVYHALIGAWSKMVLPEHVAMGTLTGPEGRPRLVVGTVHGQVLAIDPDSVVDGVVDRPHAGGPMVLDGVGTMTTTRTLAVFDAILYTTGSGLRGVPIDIIDMVSGDRLDRALIASNDATTMLLDRDVAVDLDTEVLFEIGGFDAFWSSPWLRPQQLGSWIKTEGIDLAFDPRNASLTLTNQSASRSVTTSREFEVDDSESRPVDMALGYMEQPKPTNEARQGAYHRIRFGTTGPRRPFAVTGYGIRWAQVGTKGKPS
jgi:hypothetical protein